MGSLSEFSVFIYNSVLLSKVSSVLVYPGSELLGFGENYVSPNCDTIQASNGKISLRFRFLVDFLGGFQFFVGKNMDFMSSLRNWI